MILHLLNHFLLFIFVHIYSDNISIGSDGSIIVEKEILMLVDIFILEFLCS